MKKSSHSKEVSSDSKVKPPIKDRNFFDVIPWYVYWILLGVILCAAAFLIIYKIGEYMTFLGDEGRDVLVVKRIIIDGKWTLLGPTASVGGFFLGPIYYYMMLPFLWLWRFDPTGPAVMVALFGVATVYLVYILTRNWFGRPAAIVSSSVYAVSPIIIAYSRSSWNPNVVPFFSLLLILSLWYSYTQKKYRWFALAGFSLGIGVQLHYLFLFLGVVTLCIFVLYFRSKEYILYYAVFLLGILVGVSPYLAFELRHSFPNTITIAKFIFAGEDTGFSFSHFVSTVSDVVFRLFGRLLFRYPQPEIVDSMTVWQIALLTASTLTTSIVSFILLVRRLTTYITDFAFRNSRKEFYFISGVILMWLVVPALLFGLYRKGIYDYYFGIFYAVPFIMFGWLISMLLIRKITVIFGLLLWVIVMYYNLQGLPFQYPPNRQLQQTEAIARSLFDETQNKPYNFALLASNNSDHAYRYFMELWGNAPTVIENESVDPERKTVTDQLIVLCDLPECKPLGHPLWEIAGFGQAQIEKTWKIGFMTAFKLTHYTMK